MTFDALSDCCLALPSATVDYPFDEHTACFRVSGKIFALCSRVSQPLKVNLKGDPALNRDLRASYREVLPGWHMNKEHWNTIDLSGSLEAAFIEGLLKHSYDLVAKKKPKPASRKA